MRYWHAKNFCTLLQMNSDLHKTLEQARLHSANSVAAASVKKSRCCFFCQRCGFLNPPFLSFPASVQAQAILLQGKTSFKYFYRWFGIYRIASLACEGRFTPEAQKPSWHRGIVALPSRKFLRVRKVFARNPWNCTGKFPYRLENFRMVRKVSA